MSSQLYYVTAFYRFSPMSEKECSAFASDIEKFAEQNEIMGLILVATEGCNGTIAGTQDSIGRMKAFLTSKPGFEEMQFKDSISEVKPFRRLSVQIREEIVALKKDDIPLPPVRNHHLSPEEWDQKLQSADSVVIDTRNWYETKIGKFQKALDPGITHFSEWPNYLDSQDLPKDKDILIYCTGGIRCEKAILEMQKRGFDRVFQLDGGILNYLEKKPRGTFEGECFVFDHRVAVDQELAPSTKYKLCPHCGYPATTKITCKRCDKESVICETCQEDPSLVSCSKNCAYHLEREQKAQARPRPFAKMP